MDQTERLRALEAENERLQDRILVLEDLLGIGMEWPLFLGLTPHEGKVLGALMRREVQSKEGLLLALYGNRPDGDMPEIKIIDVFICTLRKKLTRFGVTVDTLWGQGYRLKPEMREKIKTTVDGLAGWNVMENVA
jgi:two-component system cell cycle response regulator CtrA